MVASDAASPRRRLGILALQGAFQDHEAYFRRLPAELLRRVEISLVRTGAELDQCDALVIPGGESTTMKIIAGSDGFMDWFRAFVHGGPGSDGVERQPRPVWGTCAGCILLSDDVVNQMGGNGSEKEPAPKRCKYGDPIGGLAIETCRNFFGRQAESFEAVASAPAARAGTEDAAGYDAFSDFPAVFIRAPAILRTGDGVRALARVRHPSIVPGLQGSASVEEGVVVAAESRRILVTCFHPELSGDTRIHRYFVERFVLGDVPQAPAAVAAA